ncbi:hypothetical protein CYLTODRAFT_425498 [Cylindrobasidium torrendii FP15055 ss-10]|uniref:Integral membrane protein n=1 Tax=Cylindrobasidium torrendii FP15055 ss-10 TaxID=1314674 RepID=A0A0D7B1R5_9AGAR|nr:hypothetical protein CYLTODRAFT_425498 [Cylindrobasidium torrendii FP15055 ss-10]
MAFHKFFIPLLLAGMITTGSSNSLWSKWQDMQCVENCTDPDVSKRVLYEQPVWQTLQMFVGEMFCFLPVLFSWVRSLRAPAVQLGEPPLKEATGRALTGWSILLLWIPAACDLTGTTLMNIGLLYTPVSIYQMTRGALVLFVGFFSVIFLRRTLRLYQWVSLIVVMAGIALVGLSGSLVKEAAKESLGQYLAQPLFASEEEPVDAPEATTVLLGVFFILFAQIFTATQFVVEEKIMGVYSVAPLMAVGWEGFFGALSVLLLMPLTAIPAVKAQSPWFDVPRGWHQMVDTPAVLWSGLAIACSISLFNFFGLSVTRHVSATARSLTDTCRTLAIWIISLGLGWEKLLFPVSLLQILGFALLVYGTFTFNGLVRGPFCMAPPSESHEVEDEEEREALLDESATLPADLGQSGYDVAPTDQAHGQHAATRAEFVSIPIAIYYASANLGVSFQF